MFAIDPLSVVIWKGIVDLILCSLRGPYLFALLFNLYISQVGTVPPVS